MAGAFHSLSIELNQMIASHLEGDQDLGKYRLICSATRNAIDGDNDSFWRRRFLSHFDAPCKSSPLNSQFRTAYQLRRRTLKRGASFNLGTKADEVVCLKVVRELIVDSYNGVTMRKGDMELQSKNMALIERFVENFNMLDRVLDHRCTRKGRSARVNPDLLIVQLMLSHISLTAQPDCAMASTYRFPLSQYMAYATSRARPIFVGADKCTVDFEWLLHIANFWKYHMLQEQEELFVPYSHLDRWARPQPWGKKLEDGDAKLGTWWKGSYAFVERPEIAQIRAGTGEETDIQDQINGQNDQSDGFQYLRLDFPTKEATPWPSTFERILHARSRPVPKAKTRAQLRATGPAGTVVGESVPFQFSDTRFDGEGTDNNERFLASGWLNPLPPQHNIPGWQRMSMMKYYVDEDGAVHRDSLWAYEGVVLPGGQIIIGRWWCPDVGWEDDEYNGPFILWNADKSLDNWRHRDA